ncbi:hypothetical protein [Nocardia sp. NPDC052566]|uniref:hypothetical protein n=1 Tax=Nocardia sp. NPDC052566 TaxID=3364330 RepID=UPI0037C85DD0
MRDTNIADEKSHNQNARQRSCSDIAATSGRTAPQPEEVAPAPSRPWRSKALMASIVAFFCALILAGAPIVSAQPSQPGPSFKCPDPAAADQWAGGINNLQAHFEKHNSENASWSTMQGYSDAAVNVINSVEGYTLRQDFGGRRIYFNNGTFVVTTSDGKIISSFKPTAGQRYYDRQVERDKQHRETRQAGDNENDADIHTIYTDIVFCDE